MKPSKPTSSSAKPSPRNGVAELRALQRKFTAAVARPLTPSYRMNPRWSDSRSTKRVVSEFIKPNDRLTSSERLEIYSRSYWSRLFDCLYDDYPGLRAVLGEKKFHAMSQTYLAKYPSRSWTLRNLGSRLERFLHDEPHWIMPRKEMALDTARLEWAFVEAFDGEAKPIITADELLGKRASQIRFGLQPHLTLLKLRYPLDDFVAALKKNDAIREETSNVAALSQKRSRKKITLPKPQTVHLVVHRHNDSVYYKRLEPEAFQMLSALQHGASLEEACAVIADSVSQNADGASRIKDWFTTWSSLGWFCRREKSKDK